jgi:hypothetical protein
MVRAFGYLGKMLLWGALLIAVLIAISVGWLEFLSAEGRMRLFWTVSRPHYKLSFSVQTPEGKFTAQTVVEVDYVEAPSWERLFPWDTSTPHTLYDGPASLRELCGHGAALRLPDGKAVAMRLPSGGQSDVREIADLLLTKDDPGSPLWKVDGKAYPRKQINAHTGALVQGGAEIPLDLLTPMIVFTDADNPHTAHVFDPAAPEHWLGAGVTFAGARIDVTHEPVGSEIAALLPWLGPLPKSCEPYRDVRPLTTKDDPYSAETHGDQLVRLGF